MVWGLKSLFCVGVALVLFINLLSTFSYAQEAGLCERPFANICTPFFKEQKNKEATHRMNSILEEARNVALKQLGYEDPAEAFVSHLAQQGFIPRHDLTPKERKEIKSADWTDPNTPRKKFAIIKSCENNTQNLQLALTSIDTAALKEQLASFQMVAENQKMIESRLLAHNLPMAYQQLQGVCAYAQQTTGDCDMTNILAVRSEIADAQRRGNKDFTYQLAMKYVTLIHTIEGNLIPTTEENPPTELSDLKKSYQKLLPYFNKQACNRLSQAFQSVIPILKSQFEENISFTKPAHDFIIDKLYSPARRAEVEKLVNFAKESLIRMLFNAYGNRPNSRQKLTQIAKEFWKVKLKWATKLDNSAYMKVSDFALPMINLNNKALPYPEFWSSISKTNFESLKVVNAFFDAGDIQNGKKNESLTIRPGLLELYADDLRGLIGPIAHELGHKITSEGSVILGHDLRTELTELPKCLRNDTSIHVLNSMQQGEAEADVFASHVVADYLETQVPQNEKVSFFKSGMQTFCYFEHAENFTLDSFRGYPSNILRIDGLFAANRRIRKQLSCHDEKPYHFEGCELDNNKLAFEPIH